MTKLPELNLASTDWKTLRSFSGCIAVFVTSDGKCSAECKELDKICGGQIERFLASREFSKLKPPGVFVIRYPSGCSAESLLVAKIPEFASQKDEKRLGEMIATRAAGNQLAIVADEHAGVREIVLGAVLGSYSFDRYRTKSSSDEARKNGITVHTGDPQSARDQCEAIPAIAEGVYVTRDLVNEPANVLTTVEFTRRIVELQEIGLSVTVLSEEDLEQLEMRTLLAVGEGSDTPSSVVIMEWKGSSAQPLALVGKGVVFDTGGISLKPAARMEEMTMDMAGAAVVTGAMKTLAARKAPAHVIGAVGLVENMPGGRAQRPGDVVKSMKGDTVEVTNTDAEGRLVLADLLWHVQQTYEPSAIVDFATLTGAIIVGLGDDLAGIFSNDDEFASAFLDAAGKEGEGAWRMPLHDPYDRLLKSRVADVKNVGGRGAGAITAAQFLKRFVKPGCPWIHADIAGVAYSGGQNGKSPKGATGWGVQTVNRLVREKFEGK